MAKSTKVADSDSASEKSEKKTEETKAEKKITATKATKEEKTEKKTEKEEEKKAAIPKKTAYKNQFSYTDPIQKKLVNCIMKNGKKSVAQTILKNTLEELHHRGQEDPMKTMEKALQKATPLMECRPKRIGGGVYQVPIEVKPKRQESLSVRWILEGARKRKGKPMFKRLTEEFLDAANETGYAFQKREDAHRAAQANKAFAHLARY